MCAKTIIVTNIPNSALQWPLWNPQKIDTVFTFLYFQWCFVLMGKRSWLSAYRLVFERRYPKLTLSKLGEPKANSHCVWNKYISFMRNWC